MYKIINMNETIDFSTLNLKIPEQVKHYSLDKQKEIFDYLQNLDEPNKKAYEIAVNHLESSFNIYRSNGFKEWIKNKK